MCVLRSIPKNIMIKRSSYRCLPSSLLISVWSTLAGAALVAQPVLGQSVPQESPPQNSTILSRSARDLGQSSLGSAGDTTFADNQLPLPSTSPNSFRDRVARKTRQPATRQPEVKVHGDAPMTQINNVADFLDVSPRDWAYGALQDLVNRYDCVQGYPDGTFRGDRALSRYEFAAALNSCMQVMERLLLEVGSDVPPSDVGALNRLRDDFAAELAQLTTQVGDLEERVDYLENNQFSTTTKLFGQTIVGVQGRSRASFQLAGSPLPDNENEVFLSHNTQLSLFTQFNPRSLLLASFAMGDGSAVTQFPDTLGNYVDLGYDGLRDNQMQLSDLNYRQLIGNNFAVMVGPQGISPVNVFRGVNRIESAGSGPLSAFAQRNPILAIGAGAGGLGLDWQVSPDFSVQGVYASSSPEDSSNGLFGGDNGSTTMGLQLNLAPNRHWDITTQYITSYSPFGRLFTGIGDDLLIIGNTATVFNLRAPMRTHALGLGTELRINPSITFGGWVGYTVSDYLAGSGQVETLNWMSSLSFPDLGGEGNIGAIYFGQPPRITSSNVSDSSGQVRNVPNFFTNGNIASNESGGQPGTSYHIEAFYRIQLNDNISVTPGIMVILNPLQNANNDTITIGALRTTFSF